MNVVHISGINNVDKKPVPRLYILNTRVANNTTTSKYLGK